MTRQSSRFLTFLFPVVALSISVAISGWLARKSDDETIRDLVIELLATNSQQEALERLRQAIPSGDSPLSPLWLPLARMESNGFQKLALYLRILDYDPDQKEVYEEVRAVLNTLPDRFRDEVEANVAQELQNIDGIREDYLSEYSLAE